MSNKQNADILAMIIDTAEETLKGSSRDVETISFLGATYNINHQTADIKVNNTIYSVPYIKWQCPNNANSLSKKMASRLSAYAFKKSAMEEPEIADAAMALAKEMVSTLIPKTFNVMAVVGAVSKFKQTFTLAPGLTFTGSELLSLVASKDITSLLSIPGMEGIISQMGGVNGLMGGAAGNTAAPIL